MATSAAWLQKQRKSSLIELADSTGLRKSDYEGLLKADLEILLDQHLRRNESSLSRDGRFEPYYQRVTSTTSPVKKEKATVASDGEKPRGRRVTKAKDEIEATDDSDANTFTAVATRTPRAIASYAPLPPSPAAVADAIDQSTADLRSRVGDIWQNSGITERAEEIRENLSTVVGIETLILGVEAFGLQREVLPLQHAFTIPANSTLRTPEFPVKLTDLFLLFTSSFWSPTLLWVSTSFLLPLFSAYFFNLTLKAKNSHSTRSRSAQPLYRFDPLTFNVVKGLITWLVYSQGFRFWGLVDEMDVVRIQFSVPGGYQGILIGAAIGALTSIYEAILRK
ncbi:MAG: hypothetical protein M1836_005077 [Candelina mexicana]|nr:MAG: hypothetical protein M1836_005077 [Candelina mexicana]